MPDDNRTEFQRRLGVGERQVISRYAGTSRTSMVRNERTGGVAGSTTEHWSGRVDAVARPDKAALVGNLDRHGKPDYSTIRPREQA